MGKHTYTATDENRKTITIGENGQPTKRPTAKVVAATGGGAIGVALSAIGIYVIELTTGVDIPPLIEGAAGVVVTGALTLIAGWVKRP